MSDLIKRLRSWAESGDGEDGLSRSRVEREAADRIDELERQNAKLSAALQEITLLAPSGSLSQCKALDALKGKKNV